MLSTRCITRKEFCELAHVSEEDPIISVYLDGLFLMPALGIRYYERKDDLFTSYYMKHQGKNGLYFRIRFLNDFDEHFAVVDRWIYDEKEKFGGHWESWNHYTW